MRQKANLPNYPLHCITCSLFCSVSGIRYSTFGRVITNHQLLFYSSIITILTCGMSSLLRSINLILSTLLLVHLTSHTSPCQMPAFTRYLSLHRPFRPGLKLICSTNPFLRCLLIPCGLPSRDLDLTYHALVLRIFGVWVFT